MKKLIIVFTCLLSALTNAQINTCATALNLSSYTNGTPLSQNSQEAWYYFNASTNDMFLDVLRTDSTFSDVDSIYVYENACASPTVLAFQGMPNIYPDSLQGFEFRLQNLVIGNSYYFKIKIKPSAAISNYKLHIADASATLCNLITNGDFENFGSMTCPGYYGCSPGGFAAPSWVSGGYGSANIFNMCTFNYSTNPTVIGIPHSGGTMGFLATGQPNGSPPVYGANHQYFRTSFTPLANKKYYVQMFYKRDGLRDHIISDGLGMYLSNGAPVPNPQTLCQQNITPQLTPQIQNPAGNLMSNLNWLPMGGIIMGNGENHLTIGNFKPASQTTYSVTNPNVYSAACYLIDDVSITPLDITIPSATICMGQTVQLTPTVCNPPYCSSTYTWAPTTGLNSPFILYPTANPTVTTTYSLVQSFTTASGQVFTNSNTVTIHVIPFNINPVSITGNTLVCPGQVNVLTANGGAGSGTYTWQPSGFFGNPWTVSPSPTVPTTYTVYSSNTGSCVESATITLIPAGGQSLTIALSTSSLFVCPGKSANLTASPSGINYTWTPGNIPGNPITVSPSQNTIYTAFGTQTNGCVYSKTIEIKHVPCSCLDDSDPNSQGLSGNVNSLQPGITYKVIGDITISTNVNLVNNNLIMFPGTKITVLNSSAPNPVPSPSITGLSFNLIGCHLYGCGDLWDGIIVEGKVNHMSMVPSPQRTTLIEDAKVAVHFKNLPPISFGYFPPFNVLLADRATFNKNLVSIKIDDYKENQVNYPFTITNCLFTSRKIPVTTLPPITYPNTFWPSTTQVKGSNSGGTGLQTPYIDNTTYPVTPIVAVSLPGPTFPTNGIILNNSGFTSQNANVYRSISIGQPGQRNFNMFDNLQEDITALNSNFEVVNSVFQNGQRFGKGLSQGGKAIVANSITKGDVIFNNNQAQIIAGTQNGNFNNKFYDKVAAADITGYMNTIIKYNEVYSISNNYSQFLFFNTLGERGFNVKTNRYQNIVMEQNSFGNIKNAMLVSLDVGVFSVGNVAGFGRYVGLINVNNNFAHRNPFFGFTSGEYVNVGLSIADPFATAPTVFAGGIGVQVFATNNQFISVHNGADVKNISFCPVVINSNTVSMVNEPTTFNGAPTQIGINAVQLQKQVQITKNNVTGTIGFNKNVRAISTGLNGLLSVRCNTTSTTERGIEFNNMQTVDFFEDNHMQGQTFGLVLDNNAVSSQNPIGTVIRPTNNIWNGSWTSPNFKTFTTGGSSAQNSKMYIQYGNPLLNPNGSGFTTGQSNPPGPVDLYFSTGFPGPITLLSANTTPIGCRITTGGGGNGGGGTNAARILLEQAVSNGITYQGNQSETQFINKVNAYRSLKAEPSIMNGSSILNSFYSVSQTNSMEGMVSIEEDLMNNNLSSAQSKINGLSTSNLIEGNYKSYYQIFKNSKDSSYTSTDSLNLVNLANMCPYTDGGVVFQARALYNSIYDGYYKFYDNCAVEGSGSKLVKPVVNGKEPINVILKSSIFPNPNDGNFVLRINKVVEKQTVEISIFDITGKEIRKESKLLETGSDINISEDILNGTYLIKVKLQDGSTDVHRVVINK